MLIKAEKKRRTEVSQQLLDRYNANPDDFINRLLTQDETWVHHFDPETKSESMEWRHRGSPPPRKFKRQSSPGKVMASVFWDFLGVIHVDYLNKGDTINAKYYSDELGEVRDKVKQLRRGKLRRGVLLLQANAPVHTAKVAIEKAAECGFEILPHPAYSPDLAPSDFHLFPKVKKELRGRKFNSDEEVIDAVTLILEDLPESWYEAGLRKLGEVYQH